MILYFAASAEEESLIGGNLLESFWYRTNADKAMQRAGRFFLDSGAFTAFTKGAVIDLERYASYVMDNNDKITVASSLDAIGDPQKSHNNLEELNKLLGRGRVIPVFHCRSDFKWLRQYIDEGYDYIALGGMVPETQGWLARWLDQVWARLVDKDGRPIVRVHGFGLTIFKFMLKYPWYSVDSTAWNFGGRYSCVLVVWPSGRAQWVFLGERHSTRKEWHDYHIDTLSPPLREAALAFIHQTSGLTYEQLKTAKYQTINAHNVAAFHAWAETRDVPRYLPLEGLFNA